MKKILALMLILPTMTFSQKFDGKKEYDKKMVGCWKGSEEGQQLEDVNKYWVNCRLENGKSVLLFVALNPKNGAVMQSTENGIWWTSKGRYYEFHKTSGLTDIYKYEVSPDGQFASFESEFIIGKNDSSYKFTDEKTEDL
ncbi:hypothetical protein EIH07_07835 [Chryseobacterium taklimakanense]|uniref:hypothetical protein n=1 Tax=Chryseobacterium taklimakanense TaxID=536441 RepID=UPI000F5FB5E3|nr:hypothetical protein [Chryseobacterium taklimakanense]AZI22953.1 hypothetical protein EIH07_07835 [Chryseobacterium taklimakanense]